MYEYILHYASLTPKATAVPSIVQACTVVVRVARVARHATTAQRNGREGAGEEVEQNWCTRKKCIRSAGTDCTPGLFHSWALLWGGPTVNREPHAPEGSTMLRTRFSVFQRCSCCISPWAVCLFLYATRLTLPGVSAGVPNATKRRASGHNAVKANMSS